MGLLDWSRFIIISDMPEAIKSRGEFILRVVCGRAERKIKLAYFYTLLNPVHSTNLI